MNTFLDKVEGAFNEMKEEMIRLFGDHTSIHDAAQDAKEKVLAASSEHFPAEALSDAAITDMPLVKDTEVEKNPPV